MVDETKSGTIAITDCDDTAGYFEVYLVKVAGSGSVTFTVESAFDSYLVLLELTSITATDITVDVLDSDDDSAGAGDAEIVFTLEEGKTYIISVSGYDYTQLGAYQLHID